MKRTIKTVILILGMAFFVMAGMGCNKTKIRICLPTKDGPCKCKEWGKGQACDQECQCQEDDCEK